MNLTDIFVLILSITIQGIIIKYVLENEYYNCECALTWHHTFIKFFAPIALIINIIIPVFKNKYLNINNIVLSRVINSILLIYIIFAIVYCILIVIYFLKLQNNSNCECSKDWKRNVLMYPVVLIAILYIIAVIFMLYKLNKRNLIKQ